MGRISDSSFVKNDVKNLLEQAKLENELLDNFRNDFDDKMKIINEKLSGGTSKLTADDREKLLTDLGTLETVLEQNEDKFYKNISDYRIILGSLKASFTDIKELEDKLSLSEMKRREEQQVFRTKKYCHDRVNRIWCAGHFPRSAAAVESKSKKRVLLLPTQK